MFGKLSMRDTQEIQEVSEKGFGISPLIYITDERHAELVSA